MEFAKVALFDGKSPNNTVNVTAAGELSADVSGSTVGPAPASVSTSRGTVGTTSAEVADTDATRVQVTIQNLHATNALHVNLGAGAATTNDARIDPGASFSLPPGVAYTGKIQLIATGADTRYVLVAYVNA